MRFLTAAVAVAVSLGGAAACTGSSQPPRGCCEPAHALTPGRTVPVVGYFAAVGGPAGAAPSPLSGRVTFLPLASRGPSGGQPPAVSVPVGSDGRFRVRLTPSSYDVVGISPQFNGGHVKCLSSRNRPRPFFGTALHHVRLYCQRK